MKFDFPLEYVIAVINQSNNKPYVTAMFDNKLKEFEAQYPAIGTRFVSAVYGECFVTDSNVPDDNIRFNHKKILWYKTKDRTGENKTYRTGNFIYKLATSEGDYDSFNLNDYKQCIANEKEIIQEWKEAQTEMEAAIQESAEEAWEAEQRFQQEQEQLRDDPDENIQS